MIDIHCHILPGIDDGAKDLHEAQKMLNFQRIADVNCMYLTPHFYPEEKKLEEFLAERETAWKELNQNAELLHGFQLRLGAEISYCQEMLTLDLKKLTLGESNYLLLEFPYYYPAYTEQVMKKLLGQGFIPILAHVERYSYFRREPRLLKQLVDLGALAQVSAQALFNRRDRGFAMACLYNGLAQIVVSDAHNTTDRKPNMDVVYKLPEALKQLHDAFSTAVWKNEQPPYLQATIVKKTFFGYR